jgi:serine phosphatase RsbU (regulator of sigma subunit)
MRESEVEGERMACDTSASRFTSPAGRARAGGDWCEVVELSVESVALVLGDVAGHGERVARKMEAMRASVLQAIRNNGVPSSVLTIGNDVATKWGDGTLATAIVAIVDRRRRTLTFANAGHPPPLLLSHEGHAFLEHRPADLPLGVFPRHVCADYVIALPLDSLLVLYTDGVTEHDRDPLRGEDELVEAAQFAFKRPHLDAARLVARRVLERKRGHDDAAALALRTTASAGA